MAKSDEPVLFLPLPIGFVDLCVNTLWQTGCTLLCGSLRRMLFLLACMVVKYGVLVVVFWQAGRESSSSLSTLHLHFLKGTLGMKRSTTNWAVLRECGHEPLQFTGFGQLSSFSIVCLIPTVTLCGGQSRLISIYCLVQVPAGQLNC